MKHVALFASALVASTLSASPAYAGELFGGVYVHDVDTPLTKSGIEGGADIMAGYRFNRIAATPIQPYAFVAVNTAGETNYGAIGISAKFGDKVYIRPGIGLAVQTGSSKNFSDPNNDKIDFGSRILFQPELGLGVRINDRASIEASWVHMSHATLLSRQNPGIDNFGLRFNLAL